MNAARQRLFALIALTIGSGMAILDGTVVTLALPHITDNLAQQQWITTAYMLALASLVLLGGSLGDIFGRKKVYMVGLVGFGVSSALCALSPSTTFLIIARVLQGAFGALVTPGALAIINSTFPKDERSKAIGRWTAWSSIAVVAAPFVGGAILSLADWRWIFLVNIPLVVLCLIFGTSSISESCDDRPRRIDYIGALLACIGLSGLTYGLIEGPNQGWSGLTGLAIIVALVNFVIFVGWQQRNGDPMVDLRLFRSRNFSGSNIMTFLMYGALGGVSFALAIYLQEVLGYSALQAGIALLPTSIMLILFSGKIGELSGRLGARRFMTAGPIVAALGIAWLSFLHAGSSVWLGLLPGVLLFGAGITLMVAPLTATVMASVRDSQSGIASGINNAVARSASLLTVALLGLFGAANSYGFGMVLSACMAAVAGVVSFVVIRSNTKNLV